MDFLFINTLEISALTGLPHLQKLTYLLGIRPYMDRKTLITGIKRKISYQSLSEALYVEPHQGIQSGSPSRQQLRRVIKGLEQAGLIQIQSTSKNLILKCLLADSNNSVQNKPDTNPTSHSNINDRAKHQDGSIDLVDNYPKPNTAQTAKPDIPHNSENNIVFLSKNFDKFWAIYPRAQNQPKAFEEFRKLNPDEVLFQRMMKALHAQIKNHEQQQQSGCWVPHWKYPDNWLKQQCWNEPLITHTPMEKKHANHEAPRSKKSSVDMFWDACKGGADFNFDLDDRE